MGNKKVLITGGAGFIGFHLANHLVNKNYDVTLCDNLFRGKKDRSLEKFLEKSNVNLIICDLTKIEDLKKLEKNYDFVYHLAAINGTRYFYEIPETVLRTNVLSVINILDWFIETKCKKILFSSSSETYGGTSRAFQILIPTPENVPLTVDDVFNARLSYAGGKIVAELFFINYARKYNFDMSIVRYHNVYGPRMGHEHVIPEFFQRVIKKENPLKIFGATESRAFCYVEDAVRATQLVMESKNTNGEIINIGNDSEEITIKNLCEKVFDITNFHPKIEIHPAPKGSVKRRCPNITKLKKITNFEPKVNLDVGLKKTYDWYLKEFKIFDK